MAFQLAGVPEIPSPITVITFGALLIGDVRFQRAFQKYEDEKRIRCIGVMNDGDVIPLLPPQGYINAYCHIGTKVLLSDKKATITRDPQARCLLGAYILNAPSVACWVLFAVARTLERTIACLHTRTTSRAKVLNAS